MTSKYCKNLFVFSGWVEPMLFFHFPLAYIVGTGIPNTIIVYQLRYLSISIIDIRMNIGRTGLYYPLVN